jgi:hypothetical protein
MLEARWYHDCYLLSRTRNWIQVWTELMTSFHMLVAKLNNSTTEYLKDNERQTFKCYDHDDSHRFHISTC